MTALEEVLGKDAVFETPPVMASEDFGLLAEAIGVPSVYWFFGGHAQEVLDGENAPAGNHSPLFAPVIEPTLSTGVGAAMTALMSKLRTPA